MGQKIEYFTCSCGIYLIISIEYLTSLEETKSVNIESLICPICQASYIAMVKIKKESIPKDAQIIHIDL